LPSFPGPEAGARDITVLFLFLDLRVHALVLSFIVALVLHMRFARCSIAWFPGIVPV
jgi:hypothetical protein